MSGNLFFLLPVYILNICASDSVTASTSLRDTTGYSCGGSLLDAVFSCAALNYYKTRLSGGVHLSPRMHLHSPTCTDTCVIFLKWVNILCPVLSDARAVDRVCHVALWKYLHPVKKKKENMSVSASCVRTGVLALFWVGKCWDSICVLHLAQQALHWWFCVCTYML